MKQLPIQYIQFTVRTFSPPISIPEHGGSFVLQYLQKLHNIIEKAIRQYLSKPQNRWATIPNIPFPFTTRSFEFPFTGALRPQTETQKQHDDSNFRNPALTESDSKLFDFRFQTLTRKPFPVNNTLELLIPTSLAAPTSPTRFYPNFYTVDRFTRAFRQNHLGRSS